MTYDSENIQPESNPKLIRDFSLNARASINRLIRGITQEENELYVYTDEGQRYFVSEVIGLEESGHEQMTIWIATPYDKSQIRHLNSATPYVVVAFPEGVKVQFEGNGFERGEFAGVQALAIRSPGSLLRLQRRNYFRVLADEEMLMHLRIQDDYINGDFELVDISLGGCNFTTMQNTNGIEPGHPLKQVNLIIPDSSDPIPVDLIVRNIKRNPELREHVCLGCEMAVPKEEDAERLQRYLLATERRQRARQASLLE